jgi:hypothetical protein
MYQQSDRPAKVRWKDYPLEAHGSEDVAEHYTGPRQQQTLLDDFCEDVEVHRGCGLVQKRWEQEIKNGVSRHLRHKRH